MHLVLMDYIKSITEWWSSLDNKYFSASYDYRLFFDRVRPWQYHRPYLLMTQTRSMHLFVTP